ncbi:MAG TPA: hypothetical protein VFE62_02870 [Gemmataceae bacterium]|nr:hypothetical protein [Gemmataceae bacterium]
MKAASSVLAFTLICLCSAAPPTAAESLQPSDKNETKKQPADQRLFLLYALEYLQDKPLPKQPMALRAELEQRRVLAERILEHIRNEQRKKSKPKDAIEVEISEVYEGYMKAIKTSQSETIRLIGLHTKHVKPVLQEIETAKREANAIQQAVAMKALLRGAGAYLGSNSNDPLADGATTAVASLIVDQANANEKIRSRRDMLAQNLDKALASYRTELAAACENIATEHHEAITYKREDTVCLVARLAAKHHWQQRDLPFGEKLEERLRDPFAVMTGIKKRLNDEKDDAQILLKNAKAIVETQRHNVPFADAFKPFRLEFYAFAGELANRSCSLELGDDGFTKAGRPKAAEEASAYWREYQRNLDKGSTPNPNHFRQIVLAKAQSGKAGLREAYGLLQQGGVVPPTARLRQVPAYRQFIPQFEKAWFEQCRRTMPNPYVWFDFARICAQNGDQETAFACLDTAATCRYRNGALALVHADLEPLRRANQKRFDEILERMRLGR